MDTIMEFLSTAGIILTVLSLGFAVFITWMGWTTSKYSEYIIPCHWLLITFLWLGFGVPLGFITFVISIPFFFIYSLLPGKGDYKAAMEASAREMQNRKPDLYNTIDLYFSRHS